MKLQIVQSNQTNPYHNLALEQVLMNQCPQDTLIFYLWQNAHTVVIGKHQSAYSEIFMEKALEDHVKIARRSSGGGTVYHDLGNLNFTFIAQDPIFNIEAQMNLIATALQSLNIPALVNGRNDIEVLGSKVSGNAFAHQGATHLHHGTLLLNVDKSALGKYLNVNPKKLQRKNVTSVTARVQNIIEFEAVTLEQLIAHLIKSVQTYAQSEGEWLDFDAIDVGTELAHFADPDFIFGKQLKGKILLEDCFDFGCIKWEMEVTQGCVSQSRLFSDALDTQWVSALEAHVLGCAEDQLIEHIATFQDKIPSRHQQIMSSLK